MALLDSIISEIPKDLSQRILEAYPDEKKRNALSDEAILSALQAMIQERRRKQFLAVLENIEPWEENPDAPSVVETLQAIRQTS